MNGVERDFADALAEAGLEAFEQSFRIRADGRIHRYRLADDKPGKRNGWFVLYDGGAPHGFGGDWKSVHRLDWIAMEVNGRRVAKDAYDRARQHHADQQRRHGRVPSFVPRTYGRACRPPAPTIVTW